MPSPILATKLYIPPLQRALVARLRLIERLNDGLHRKLTLISAPAGFGKTTLVSEWVGGCGRPVAWLSLDEGDSDPARYLTYFVAAIQHIAPQFGEGVLRLLASPQPPSSESILTALLNDVGAIPGPFIFVLDDYHAIDAKPVEQTHAFLVEHLPPQMHLVITTREDPQLPLARLRARGQLTELRAADLRFTSSEAAEFLNQSMGLGLSADDVAALEARTEGWIAGLQLAALSLQGHTDATGFIQSFTGNHRFVLDYLVEEVLQQQPADIQTFLLRTSILDRLCGPLCDAVLGMDEETALSESSAVRRLPSAVVLEQLERANLFLVPLDNERRWYRYHHLFAEVLRARLLHAQPGVVTRLHRQAGVWWEQNHFRAEAIQHALAARDFAHAADLIERERAEQRGQFLRSSTWLGWVRALPPDLVRARPALSIGFAWELLFLGQLEAAGDRLRDAEQSLESSAGGANTGELSAQRALVAVAQAFRAQALGDVAATIRHASRALDIAPPANHYVRGLAGSLLALAYLSQGELEAAYQSMAAGVANVRADGGLNVATSGTFVLASIRVAQGRLHEAVDVYAEALQRLNAQGDSVREFTADLYLGLSNLYREMGDAEQAGLHLRRSEELGRPAAPADWLHRLHLAQAQIQEDTGDLDGALASLAEAERLYYRSPLPVVRPVAAMRARLWIKQGRSTEAEGWANARKLTTSEELSYLREFEHITLARLLILPSQRAGADRRMPEALDLLERLLRAAESGGRTGSVIEILLLLARAHAAQGSTALAFAPLERALTLAEPAGYVRIFVNEGQPMQLLIVDCRLVIEERSNAAPQSSNRLLSYVNRLLNSFPQSQAQSVISNQQSTMIEPLSARELEILRLIAHGLSNREIGQRLFLALSTVKGHNRVIFDKLQVKSRTEALAQARSLGIL